MKALVTGSAGFIGGHLVEELRWRGHQVAGLDKRSGGRVDVTCDLAEPGLEGRLEDVLADVEIVFHLAGRPGVRDRHPDAGGLRHRDNVVATRRLLEVLPLHVAVVAASSSSVYGGAQLREGILRPSREDDPLRPRGGYARSKLRMEQLCRERRRRGGLVTVLRPFTVVGERQRTDMALAEWAGALYHGRPIRLLGSPDRIRDLTDVRDVVRASIYAAETRHNGVINVGTGRGHRLSDMAAALVEASGSIAQIEVAAGYPDEVEATLADTSTCERVLGFVPRTDLAEVAQRVWTTFVAGRHLAGAAAR